MFGKKKSEPVDQSMKSVVVNYMLPQDNMLNPERTIEVTVKSSETRDLGRLAEKVAWQINSTPDQIQITKWGIR
jgi:hypothetical protein